MRLSGSKKDIDFLSKQYEGIDFTLLDSNNEETLISCFICKIDNVSNLEKNWEKIASMIAVSYQSELKNEFAAWNIYLSFVSDFKVPIKLKYEIENDTYFMRKMIVDDTSISSQSDLIEYFNNEILGYDLVLSKSPTAMSLQLYPRTAMRYALESLGEIPSGYKDESRAARLDKVRMLMDKVIGA
jgi:hypothetical protein